MISQVRSVETWSTAWIRSQNSATFRIACSTKTSSLWTSTIPTTWLIRGRELPLFSRPFDQRADRAPQLPSEPPAGRVALTWVVDVERNGLIFARVWLELGAERDDPDVDRDEAFVQQVRRDPGGGNVVPRRRRVVPAWIRVENVEERVALAVEELDLRKERVTGPQDAERHLDPDRTADVGRVHRVVTLDDTHPAHPRHTVSGTVVVVGPLPERARAVSGLEVVGDDVRARAVADDAAVVEQDRALAQPRNRLHVV